MNRLLPCSKPSYKAVAVILLAAMVFMILSTIIPFSSVSADVIDPSWSYTKFTSAQLSYFKLDMGSGSGEHIYRVSVGRAGGGLGSSYKDLFSSYGYALPVGYADVYFRYVKSSYYFSTPSNYDVVNSQGYNLGKYVSNPVISFCFDIDSSKDKFQIVGTSYDGKPVIGYSNLYFNYQSSVVRAFFQVIPVTSSNTAYSNGSFIPSDDLKGFYVQYGYYGSSFALYDNFPYQGASTIKYFSLDNPIVLSFDLSEFFMDKLNITSSIFVLRMVCSSSFYSTLPSSLDSSSVSNIRTSMSTVLDFTLSSLNFSAADGVAGSSSVLIDDAYNSGYNNGFTYGFSDGSSHGYSEGYAVGYDEGVSYGSSLSGDINQSITNFVPSILGGVADFIIKVTDFEVFGISVLKVLGTVGVLLILVAFIKMIT